MRALLTAITRYHPVGSDRRVDSASGEYNVRTAFGYTFPNYDVQKIRVTTVQSHSE